MARAQSIVLHPWVDNPCNVYAVGDMLRSVAIPDVAPAEMLAGGSRTMLELLCEAMITLRFAQPTRTQTCP